MAHVKSCDSSLLSLQTCVCVHILIFRVSLQSCWKLWQEALQPPGAHLQLQHQVQSIFPQRVDGIDNQCYYNVNAIRLVLGDARLRKETEAPGWRLNINRLSTH